jgi:hypothetical protein
LTKLLSTQSEQHKQEMEQLEVCVSFFNFNLNGHIKLILVQKPETGGKVENC